MHAEPHPILVTGSANRWRGRHHRFASARPKILVASSTGSTTDHEEELTLRRRVTGLDGRSDAGARPLVTSTRRVDALVQGRIASGTFVTGHCAIAAPASITSSARHPLIGRRYLRPVDPARQPRRLTDRQLTPTT